MSKLNLFSHQDETFFPNAFCFFHNALWCVNLCVFMCMEKNGVESVRSVLTGQRSTVNTSYCCQVVVVFTMYMFSHVAGGWWRDWCVTVGVCLFNSWSGVSQSGRLNTETVYVGLQTGPCLVWLWKAFERFLRGLHKMQTFFISLWSLLLSHYFRTVWWARLHCLLVQLGMIWCSELTVQNQWNIWWCAHNALHTSRRHRAQSHIM